jgi:hypothetical protein
MLARSSARPDRLAQLTGPADAPLADLNGWDVPAAWEDAPPPDEELTGPAPDPYCAPPDGADAWAADIPADLLFEYLATIEPAPVPEVLPAGPMPRKRRAGCRVRGWRCRRRPAALCGAGRARERHLDRRAGPGHRR